MEGHCYWEKDHANCSTSKLQNLRSKLTTEDQGGGSFFPVSGTFLKSKPLHFWVFTESSWRDGSIANVGRTVVLEHISVLSISFCKKKGSGQFCPKKLEFRGDTRTFLKCEKTSKMPGTWDSIENALLKPVDRTVQHCNKKHWVRNIRWRLTKDGFDVCFFGFRWINDKLNIKKQKKKGLATNSIPPIQTASFMSVEVSQRPTNPHGLSTGCWQMSRNEPRWFDGDVTSSYIQMINMCIRNVVYIIVISYIYIYYTDAYHTCTI